MELLSPKIDYVFKKLFSASDSDDILRDFLASVLEIEPESIGDIEIQNTEIVPDYIGDKYSMLDLAMKVGERLINVEMQISKKSDYPERTLFYTCKRYTGDLKEGENYSKLKQTISINIVDFNLFSSEECHSRFVVQEQDRHEILTDKLRIDFLELPKAETDKSIQVRKLKKWLNFFNIKSEEDAEMLEKTDDVVMKQAVFKLREMSADEKIRERARIREIALRDRASDIDAARNEGKIEGKIEGKAEGKTEGKAETVKSLMRVMNWSAAEAMNAAGIPAGEQAKYLKLINSGEGTPTA